MDQAELGGGQKGAGIDVFMRDSDAFSWYMEGDPVLRSSVKGMVAADQRSFDGLTEVIQAGQQDGSVRAGVDPRGAAIVLQGLIRGVAAIYLTHSELTHLDAIRQTCQAWIHSALSA